ncbi:MAG: peroxiredoxin [Myxococcota bacterium]
MEAIPAPPASFTDETGATVSLASLLGRKTIVLYFYPKDETPGCTAEACSFRDHYEDFVAAGAEVIGVSSDDAASHEAFKAKHRLPFRLLSDPAGLAAQAFGVKKTLGLLPGRVTFVIDRQGVIRHRFDSQLRVKKHVAEALALVKALEAKAA